MTASRPEGAQGDLQRRVRESVEDWEPRDVIASSLLIDLWHRIEKVATDYAREQVEVAGCAPHHSYRGTPVDCEEYEALRGQAIQEKAALEAKVRAIEAENVILSEQCLESPAFAMLLNRALEAQLAASQVVVQAAQAYVAVVGDDTKELDALVDALSALAPSAPKG